MDGRMQAAVLQGRGRCRGFAGRPLCLHMCPVLYVLLILFFPKMCPFLPANHRAVQEQRGSSVPHSELFPFSK